jgi:16S rRNA (cytosine1402-N4)-methyltransferase
LPIAFEHQSVLWTEVLEGLALQPGGLYLDATVGGAGHSLGILDRYGDTQIWGLDQDPEALAVAQERLAPYGDRVHLWRGNFQDFAPGDLRFQGILADLGVNSAQLDHGDRGFSFRQDAPLDMRMNPDQDLTAATIVNHWSETDLANLFYEYGEERFSRRIARQIVQQRPLQRTWELADLIRRSVPNAYRNGRIHPATRVFQSLRIAVNSELTALDRFLSIAPQWLAPEGRLVIISFHSLEDRRVKYAFRECPHLQVITKKPIVPSTAEIETNKRSRSAKLRIAQQIAP